MHIGWVGGLDRSAAMLTQAAEQAGHSLEVHTGRIGGRGSDGLSRLIERSDVVVIVIEINSHGGALRAKDLARRRGRPAIIIRKPSVSALQRILHGLTAQRPGTHRTMPPPPRTLSARASG